MPSKDSNRVTRHGAEVAADIAAALMWGPKTTREILVAIGMSLSHYDRCNRYLKQFHGAGCIYIHSWPRKNVRCWEWQSKPFEHKDQEHP